MTGITIAPKRRAFCPKCQNSTTESWGGTTPYERPIERYLFVIERQSSIQRPVILVSQSPIGEGTCTRVACFRYLRPVERAKGFMQGGKYGLPKRPHQTHEWKWNAPHTTEFDIQNPAIFSILGDRRSYCHCWRIYHCWRCFGRTDLCFSRSGTQHL
jgi:hypothetical protein